MAKSENVINPQAETAWGFLPYILQSKPQVINKNDKLIVN
jgi:hypothetical protein